MTQSNIYKLVIALLILAIAGVSTILIFTTENTETRKTDSSEIESNTDPKVEIFGTSVQGREIEAYRYGNGKTHIVFVGGIHGGYEWNSSVLAYRLVDYLSSNPKAVPENLTVTIIPSANPDGIFKIIGKEGKFSSKDVPLGKPTSPGRFNANEVDLNRNFDCKWQPKSVWQNKTVSAGDEPFSEPESRAIRDFTLKNRPLAFIFWHSQGNAVYASECQKGILPETLKIMEVYSKASGYKADPTYDAYETTGDADAWLAKIGIPAITVELKTHESVDWEENLAGVKAVLQYYSGRQ